MTADEAAARVVSAYSVTLGKVKADESMGELRRIVREVFEQAIEEERDKCFEDGS